MVPTVIYENGLSGGWFKKVLRPVVKTVKKVAKQVTIKKIVSVPKSAAKVVSKGAKAVGKAVSGVGKALSGGGKKGESTPPPEPEQAPVYAYEPPLPEPVPEPDNTVMYAVISGVAVVAVGALLVVLYKRRKAKR